MCQRISVQLKTKKVRSRENGNNTVIIYQHYTAKNSFLPARAFYIFSFYFVYSTNRGFTSRVLSLYLVVYLFALFNTLMYLVFSNKVYSFVVKHPKSSYIYKVNEKNVV